ncbi:hypothetical protein [Arsukibacterium indicum]|uniref:Uncharacterized protein n=1 Tax=Arsukibacterium indicum TaxID=2848612 RepID=A0ABS6MKB5_9GAMM|nr:hypothetical protein [Arsukibacterium indicum]MBV2129253.1 hypothetical protein [Arsukibacterium indicum]
MSFVFKRIAAYCLVAVFSCFAMPVLSEETSANCSDLPAGAIAALPLSFEFRHLQLACDKFGHRLEPNTDVSWLSLLNKPFDVYARQPLKMSTESDASAYFLAVSAKQLNNKYRTLLHRNFLKKIFPNYSVPSLVTEFIATTSEGVELRLYLMPDRGIVCFNNCAYRQIFLVKSNTPFWQDTKSTKEDFINYPASESAWPKQKIAWAIVLVLFNWPVLTLYMFFMLMPAIYNDLNTQSPILERFIKHDRKGGTLLLLIIGMQWRVIRGKYTADARQANCLTMVRIGQGMVVANIVLFYLFITS